MHDGSRIALSEEIWYRTYRTTLSTMDLTARLLRYVDNRLCLSDPSWDYEICFANFLHPEFYGHPIILETEPDQEFLGFCIEFEPFARRYSPPRDFNQVMAPFSASPLAVQLSGFVSRLFLSPNVRTLHTNEREVLPHCTVCTELQVFPSPI